MSGSFFQTHAVRALAGRTLRWYFDSPSAYVTLLVFYLITGWLFAAPLFLVKAASLRGLADLAPLLLAFLVPALTMGLLADELKSGTFETLATLPLEDWDIVLGKYLGFAALHLVCVGGLLFYVAVLGLCVSPSVGLDWGEMLGTLLGLASTGLAFGAVGIFASSLGRSQVVSFVAAFLVCFVLFLLGKSAALLPGGLGNLVGYLGLDSHVDNLAKGVLDSRDLVYFASLVSAFLYLTVQRLRSRRF
ncbi:MAG: ABC transporter permease subunit [Elusimicrobia bacterium]|nr:ABC transporter permease subunit [Elusimicrobiota bacterium]